MRSGTPLNSDIVLGKLCSIYLLTRKVGIIVPTCKIVEFEVSKWLGVSQISKVFLYCAMEFALFPINEVGGEAPLRN